MDVGEIARRWRLLQGSNNWDGLLHPLDLDLRKNVLLYGDKAQAAYDAFNSERRSKYAGSSRYGKRDFFQKVGLPNMGYQISRFLYATSKITDLPEAFFIKSLSREAWSSESNWMGYVAVTTQGGPFSPYGRRDIAISWRGSVQPLEWIEDFNSEQVPVSSLLPGGGSSSDDVNESVRSGAAKVHRGWFEIYTSDDPKSPFNKRSAREQVLAELKKLIEVFKNERYEMSITLTGHSLGAALATLCAFDIVINGLNRLNDADQTRIPVTVFAFGSPRVGNSEFKQSVVKLLPELKILRVTNSPDLVPRLPIVGYEDVGVEIRTDTGDSPYLKDSGNASSWHTLEAYLHAVAGMQGKGKRDFKLVVDRDVGLVNKHVDWLKEEELIPGSWWIEKNKGMVQGLDGHWRLDQDVPAPEDSDG